MPVALIAAGIGAAGSIASSAMQSGAAEDAANTQANAAKSAQALQKQEFDQTQANLQPWMTAGQSALSQIQTLFGLGPGGNGTPNTAAMQSALQNYPGYQFAQQQGLQSLDRVAASRGLTLSGAQLKDAQTYGQGLATSTFGNYLSGLQSISAQGLGAAGNLGNFGQNYANSSGNLILNQGQAQAAGTVGSANAITSGLQGALNNSLMAYQLYGNQPISGFTPTSALSVTNPYAGVSPESFDMSSLSTIPWGG